MTYLPELEQIRKNQIIEAALKVVAREGYFHLSMEKVAKEAGLSKGGVAHYFPSKKELFIEVFIRFFETIFERGKEVVERSKDPLDALISFVWLYDWDDPRVNEGYPILFDFMALAVRDEDFRKIFLHWIDRWTEMLEKLLRQCKEQNMVISSLDEASVARTISAIYQGIGERWYIAPEKHSTSWAHVALKEVVLSLLRPYLCKNNS